MGSSRKINKRQIKWTAEAKAAYEKSKEDFANAVLLVHPNPDAEVRLLTYASEKGLSAGLKAGSPLVFFRESSLSLSSNKSTYDRELEAYMKLLNISVII